MKKLTGIKSETKPMEIDDISSETTIYVRYNIEETVETDPVFNTEKTVYVYDETQYSFPEWYRINNKQIIDRLNQLEEYIRLNEKK